MRFDSALTILDKPKHAQTALKRAVSLQEATGLHLDVASFCWQAAVDAPDVFGAPQRRTLKQEILLERKQWQRAIVRDHGIAAKDATIHTAWTNDIAEWIRRSLEKKPRDLIIKSVHHTKNSAHSALDWALLRNSPAPVLLTSTRKRKPAGRVLAAIDLRHTDRTHKRLNRKVLEAAASFADVYDAELHCVCALEISNVLRDLDIIDEKTTKKRMIAENQDRLNDLLKPYSVKKSHRHFPVGKVGQVVTHAARKLNADLLVAGSCAHRVRQLVGLGNSAERILERSTGDVLVVHP